MSITHIVMFQFKSEISATDVTNICQDLLALKDRCVNPETQKPYILSVTGGRNNSPEGFEHGITHAFVVHFANEADRDYYSKKDPAHLGFVKNLGGKVDKLQVIDYEPGIF